MKTVFYHRKLNKDNKLTKTIYENYLRTSMPCSFPCCTSYTHTSKTSKNEHYIIPSKKALINYLPLFIDKNINTIILNSTLEQIRIDSLTEYKRITEAIKNKFVFYNNFFVQTYVEQLNNKITYTERMNDSFENCENDYEDVYEYKCIERALQYYKNHVNKKIIVVTPNNVHLVPALYNNESEIADLIAKGLKEKTMYDEYYNEERLNTLCQQGSVLKGILYINAHNSFGGIVHAEYKGRRIRVRIDGRNDLNRALNMDGVYVEIKKEESIENGTAHNNIINITDETNNGENGTVQNNINKTEEKNTDIENGTAKMSISNSIADKSKGVKLEPEVIGKVVGIYKRDFISLIGTIDKNSINGSGPQFVLVIPLDKKIPKIRIKTSQVDEIEDKRIMVRINEWDRESYYPFGSYVRCMGSVGDEKTEIESILLSNGIDYSNYADTFGIENVIENLNKKIESYKTEGEKSSNEGGKRFKNGDDKSEIVVPENEHLLKVELENVYKNVLEYESKVREDIRDLDVLSIDPPGCTDIDDALHCRKVGDLYEVGVHIADVSFFVEKDSLLDNEALKRGTTVYLTDRRFDMLPTYLSSNLCSLIAEQDRLAFSVFIYFDKDFTIQNTTFKKTVIRSKRSFTYDQAQSEMTEGQYKDDIRMLNSIAKNLKHKRIAAGALELSSTELKIYTKNRIARSKTHANKNHIDERVRDAHDDDLTVENELPEIDRIEQKVLNETNSLVEEFMLLANILVANELYAHHKDSAMLRRHPKFADDSFDELKEYLSKRNIDLNYLSSKELNDSIKTIEDGQFKELIKKIITRSMNQAVYFSSGSVPYEDFLHYGLAASIYTHFTSPIRRYADLIVHRQLDYVISNKSNLYDNDKIEEICRTINYRKRNAMYANLECDRLFTYLYLKGKILEERGYITRIKNGGIVIYIPSLGIEEIIKLEYEFDEERNCFVRDGNYVYELYSDVKVKIQENDEKFFIERHFDIEIIEE